MLQDRAGIIVLREDLDFYAIPPKAEIDHNEMIEVKRAAGRVLLGQDGIFSGLRRSEEAGTTEQHLIEMLTAGYHSPSHRYFHGSHTDCSTAASKTTTIGATEHQNPVKLSFVAWHWLDCGQTSRVTTSLIVM